MSKLSYKITDIPKWNGLDEYLDVVIEVSSVESDKKVAVQFAYDIDSSEVRVDTYQGEPTYVDYGSTSAMYDDGFEVDFDSLEVYEAIKFFSWYLLDENGWHLHDDESIDPEGRKEAVSVISQELGCTEEELVSFLDKLPEEFFDKVEAELINYYKTADIDWRDFNYFD